MTTPALGAKGRRTVLSRSTWARFIVGLSSVAAAACSGAATRTAAGSGGRGAAEGTGSVTMTDGVGASASSGLPPSSTDGPLGANVDAIHGGVDFRVWAPDATGARVTGDFPEADVAMESASGGRFAVHVAGAHAGSAYRFVLDTPSGSLERTDPWCRALLADGSCTVIDPSAYAWTTPAAPAWQRPARNASVVYELHVGSFTPEGTLAAATAKLSDLADLGVNVVELMPVQDFGGKPTSWGYNPQLYLAPKPDYGPPDDLRAFVDEAHHDGIAVWLDTVVNHTDRWTKAPLYCFEGGCPTGGFGLYYFPEGSPYAMTPWGPRPDYTDPDVAAMLLGSVSQWLGEYRGDGFRWDSVSNIRGLDGQGTTP